MFIPKSTTVAKLFFILTFSGLLMYTILGVYSLRNSYPSMFDPNGHKDLTAYRESRTQRINRNLKYILLDTKNFVSNEYVEGKDLFFNYQCPHFNCFLTTNEKKLKSKEEFDAVVVNVTDLAYIKLPASRPQKQVYVFYGMEPSDHTPVCRQDADNFFNYTWSYKLTSDIVSPFIVIQDRNGTVVAPSKDVEWAISMKKSSLSREQQLKLKKKYKAVAMIVRSCRDQDGKIFAERLRDALKVYNETLRIFGCEKGYPLEGSDAVIAKEYFFVLVTTTSVAVDYVTDKVLKAFWNNAVPIIKARADLTKFFPSGSYVNAHMQTPEQIAALVHYSIDNPSVYQSFFKWRNFYSIRKRDEFDGICQLCSLLNNGGSRSSSAANLSEWWESSKTNKLKCKNSWQFLRAFVTH